MQDLYVRGRAARALPVFAKAVSDPAVGGYARLYEGRAQLALNQPRDAAASAERAGAGATGYLAQAALVLLADADQALGDNAGAVRALQTLTARAPLNPEPVYLRLGNAANLAGDRALAIRSWRTVYDTYPLSDQADDAAAMLTKAAPGSLVPTPATVATDLSRAEQLFGARRYTDARKAFSAIRTVATADDRDRADLRVAECDEQFLKHATSQALDALKDLLARPTFAPAGDALLLSVRAARRAGHVDEYVALANAFVDQNPTDALAETLLFDMSQYFTRQDDDADGCRRPMRPRTPIAGFRQGCTATAWRGGPAGGRIRTASSRTTVATFSRRRRRRSVMPTSGHRLALLDRAGRRAAEQPGRRDRRLPPVHRGLSQHVLRS